MGNQPGARASGIFSIKNTPPGVDAQQGIRKIPADGTWALDISLGRGAHSLHTF
ncbi:MAG: hypothetical protein SOR94_04460 [Lawsonella sp.]|nr:hypothetical protein [Lawsonella sp.]